MKSKYRIYALLILLAYSGFIKAMEEIEETIEISQEEKQEWQKACIHWVFFNLLQVSWDRDRCAYVYTPLSFELVGSKNFIANELGKKLDDPELQDGYFKNLARKRDDIFKVQKVCVTEEQWGSLWHSHIKSIDAFKLLPFIQSLEESIKKRIKEKNLTEEITWRKENYLWLNFETGYCRDLEKCLALDIEKEFALKKLQSGDYGWGWCAKKLSIGLMAKYLGLDVEEELVSLDIKS